MFYEACLSCSIMSLIAPRGGRHCQLASHSLYHGHGNPSQKEGRTSTSAWVITSSTSAGPIQWAVQRGRYMSLETTAPLRDDPTIKLPALAPRQSALLLLHHSQGYDPL